jgi:homocysteine S-methyltransferase
MKTLSSLNLDGLHVLDGAMATELERRGFDLNGPLWSAHVLESTPEAIAAVHRDYLQAGADCLLTASYQVSAEGFEKIGLSPEAAATAADRALRSAVSIAERVRSDYQASSPRPIWIAASLGPYGAMLHNGAEYHGNYAVPTEELTAFHRRRIAVLAQTGADFLAFESVPSLDEAEAILIALREFPSLPAYISFTCRDGAHVAHGESLQACGELLDRDPQIIAIGMNCTPPRFIRSLTRQLASVTRKPIVVYPNSGEQWDADRQCWVGEGELEQFREQAREWRAVGAQWIGGCCRTSPDHVRAVAEMWASR